MSEKLQYRLTANQKSQIAQNLMDILERNASIESQTASFVYNWMLTGPDEKRKAFFDVWDIVLKNFMPKTRPILFRSCQRRKDGIISSFTGRLESARRFSNGKGLLLMCDTSEELRYESQHRKKGAYLHTFYPLVELLKNDDAAEAHMFSERVRSEYIGEDEYIMRTSIDMPAFTWYQSRKEKAEAKEYRLLLDSLKVVTP